MLADLIRDDADENNENVPESAPKRRTRMSNESERKRTRFVPSPSLDGASGERASGGAHEGYGANAMTQDSARFSRYSGVKSPKSAAVLSEDDEDALEDAARALSAARLMRSRSRTATANAAEMRRVNAEASTSVERPVSSGGRRDLEYWGVPEARSEALAAKGVARALSVANGVSRAARRHAREGKFVVQRADERGEESRRGRIVDAEVSSSSGEHRDVRASLRRALRGARG